MEVLQQHSSMVVITTWFNTGLPSILRVGSTASKKRRSV